MTVEVCENSKLKMTTLRRLYKQANGTNNPRSFKVAVFGQVGVGKTAFIVRFVTKRFIGEYDPTLESIYQRSLVISPDHAVLFEIMDTSRQEEGSDVLKEKIKWADCFVLLYSITDRVSFSEIVRRKFLISHTIASSSQKLHHEPVIAIVGNKKDLEVERMISTQEGAGLAASLRCCFHEITARESVDEVEEVFEDLYKAWWEAETIVPPQPRSGLHGPHFELPAIHNHHITLPYKRKHKSFKHIDRMPRMQGSLGIDRYGLRRSYEYPLVERKSTAVNRGTSSLSSSPVPKPRFSHNDSTSINGELTFRKHDFQLDIQTSSDSDAERHYAGIQKKKNIPQGLSDASESDAAELSPYDNSSSDSCVEEDSYDVKLINTKEAAEEFSRKITVLSLE